MDAAPPDDDALLYGHDPAERIVALHPVGPATMRLYRRRSPTEVTTEDVRVHPFFFLSDADLLRGFPRDRFQFQELAGRGFFRYVVAFPDRGAYFDALRHVERATETAKARPDEVYLPGSPEQQYLMQTGRTLFKGMAFDDLVRLQLDIEVYSPKGFPQATVPEHRIILVALSDSTGWSRLVGTPEMTEEEVLRETLDLVKERDPDVIEGHNIQSFDFPYLFERCRRHGVPVDLGRDGSPPRSYPTSMRFAERQVEFDAVEIAGRHVIDTLHQTMAFDVFKRDLPNYTLKGAARYFGFAPEGRTYVPGDQIAHVWDTDPHRLMEYAIDDATETERLARFLSGSTFYLTQMVPMPYGQAARTGPAAKVEALFVRGYLHARHSLPRADFGSQVVGGYTDVFVTGVVGPVVYADVESLYPSIMLTYDVQPKGDALGLFPRLLRRLTGLRFETKDAMREADDAHERGELDARQSAYKIVINSFYGNMGFGYALFNDFAEADRVAATGQDLLRQIMRLARAAGARVVEVDTDGVLFVPPDSVVGEAAERQFVERLSEQMPDGIRIGFDGRFQRMLSYKKKNYALLDYDGHLKFKGSSLVSRSSERFGRAFVREAIRLLLEEDVQGLHDLYLEHRRRIEAHDWQGVESFQRTETLKTSLADYEQAVAAGERTRSAAYEVAAREAARTGRAPRVGDRVSYYLGEGGGRVFEAARPARDWSPAAPDESTAFYLDRLDQLAGRFEPFFETPAQFRLVFSEEDLFGFDPSAVRLVVRERDPEEVEDDVPF
ncbi:DNA polymerase domain-containing protein [Rubrivirga litoralis]|uniref:DNA-directed DNA polymerase n=1 Tax=Rubrivirga litoralis TaxID=3075598 RepID=A0ABU3BVN6_9BACT|nr:DNA polymerase domain-containing protein [Rubrivirga sp. F394]MDT0633216.1 DNA polymerase domain-containing protein [Rubrivirga sp. F394]